MTQMILLKKILLSQETLLLGAPTGEHLSHTNVDSVILGKFRQNS